MHTKYSKEILHNHQVKRFHDRNLLSHYKVTQLTKIGNSFNIPIKLIQQRNQLIVQKYLSNNIDECAQISTDNYIVCLAKNYYIILVTRRLVKHCVRFQIFSNVL